MSTRARTAADVLSEAAEILAAPIYTGDDWQLRELRVVVVARQRRSPAREAAVLEWVTEQIDRLIAPAAPASAVESHTPDPEQS